MKRKHKKVAPQVQDLDVTPFLNLMVVLIPFLLARFGVDFERYCRRTRRWI